MSERKRLTDADVVHCRRLVKEATERPILAEVSLEMDHDQAREDVKRLVAELRNMAPFHWRGTGAYCWCSEARGSACFNKRGEPTGRGCVQKNAILAEVSS